MLGYTELSIGKAEKNSKLSGYLDKIMLASQRAVGLVQQILSFSRQSKQELSPISLRPIVKEVLKLLKATLPATIEIRQEIDNTDSKVMADQTQIHQVMMNLCTNAAHAMEEVGGTMTVSLSEVFIDSDAEKTFTSLSCGRHMKLSVSDTGCGISQDIMDKIFDPFFTTKEVGKGTGMGLSVLHGIIKSHKGEIKLYSELGKGSTFHVYFPIIDKSGANEIITAYKELPRGNERILIVDDEKNVITVAKHNLENLGYSVVIESSPLQALERFTLSQDRFDLVITDMTMPRMTGIVLAEKLREICPDIPVILSSGLDTPSIRELVDQGEINAFLKKPFSKKGLATLVRKILDKNK